MECSLVVEKAVAKAFHSVVQTVAYSDVSMVGTKASCLAVGLVERWGGYWAVRSALRWADTTVNHLAVTLDFP